MADELIDIYDENNNETGIEKMKSEAHIKGLWHRCAHIWIYNSVGEVLFQLRSDDKDFYPNRWDVSAAGHIGAGESPEVGAAREVEEELGIPVKPGDLKFYGIRPMEIRFKEMKNNEFFYTYFLKYDGSAEDLILQEEEVDAVKFMSIDTVKNELKTMPEKYVAGGEYWLEMLDVLDELKK